VSHLPKPYDLYQFAEVASTNDEARRLAQEGIAMPAWILADRQTAGRGRFKRAWVSSQGNFMASLLCAPALPNTEKEPAKKPIECFVQIGFVAGLAVYDALHDLVASDKPACKLSLKWPNDILLGGRKVAGILLETISTDKPARDALAVGIGINLIDFPADMPYPATSLKAAAGIDITPAAVLARVAEHFDNWLGKWQKQGFLALREVWLARAHGLNDSLQVQLADKTIEDIFKTVTQTGQLVLEDAEGQSQSIASGDIYFTPRPN